ncbi:MAG: hypothetical protein MHM6MM_000739 [Cercozoa sp. M6MM]
MLVHNKPVRGSRVTDFGGWSPKMSYTPISTTVVAKYRANYDFDAAGQPDCISVSVGAEVLVTNVGDDGWLEAVVEEYGHLKYGLVPESYCELVQSNVNLPVEELMYSAAAEMSAPMSIEQPSGQGALTSQSGPIVRERSGQAQEQLNESSRQALLRRSKNVNRYVPKNSATRVGIWASNMSRLTAWCGIMLGAVAAELSLEDAQDKGVTNASIGLTSTVIGILVLLFENTHGQYRSPTRTPVRALVYLLLAIPHAFTTPTLLVGAFYVLASFVHMMSALMGETFEPPPRQRRRANGAASRGMCYCLTGDYRRSLKESGRLGEVIFLIFFFVAQGLAITFYMIHWFHLNADQPDRRQLHPLAPIAKGFGISLDINCAVILLPVLRTMLRVTINRSTRDQGCCSKCLRCIMYFIPLDKALHFHKLCGVLIAIGAVGHTLVHFVGYGYSPENSLNKFGAESYFTGAAICAVMLMMYGASFHNIRRGQFEIFWYTHHLFIAFYILLFIHGKNFWNPNVWKAISGPLFLYVCERILRKWKGSQPAVVLSVTHMSGNGVFCVEFAKEGVFATRDGREPYKEGQYMFINCPYVSEHQWHPFTISSAPGEDSVTLHIRVMKEGSWTAQVEDFFRLMGPIDATTLELKRHTKDGLLPGQITGPDGRPILRVDGPHSAPTQHVRSYKSAMIVGAGIGVTPLCSTLKSIVHYTWPYSIGEGYPQNATFVWVCAHRDVDNFRWMCRIIKECANTIASLRQNSPETMRNKNFEFHVYITSPPPDARDPNPVIDDDVGFWGQKRKLKDEEQFRVSCGWDELALYKALKNPARYESVGDIQVHSGRPNWDVHFQEMANRHRGEKTAVAFCGNPMIAADLATKCHQYSDQASGTYLTLHKENF